MQPRLKYITKDVLSGLIEAARDCGYVHQAEPHLAENAAQGAFLPSLLTIDIQHRVLTAEVWTGDEDQLWLPPLLDINFDTYVKLPELDRYGNVMPVERPQAPSQLFFKGKARDIPVVFMQNEPVESAIRRWEGGLVPVLEKFDVQDVGVSWAWRLKEGLKIIFRLSIKDRDDVISVWCPETDSPEEAGERCRAALDEMEGRDE